MDISQAFINSVNDVMRMFALNSFFDEEFEENVLTSASQVNVFISFTNGLTGNIMVGFSKGTAIKIASQMMGGMEIENFDANCESAVAELVNMMAGNALTGIKSEVPLDFSPPSVAVGEDMFIVLSKVKSNKLIFKLDSDCFSIAYAIE